MEKQTHQHTFAVEQPARLVVENVRGAVVVRGSEKSDISVLAELDPDSGDLKRTYLDIRQDEDGTVYATVRSDPMSGLLGRSFNPCRVNFTIHTPQDCSLQLSSVSSSAVLEDLRGSLELSTVSGNLALTDISGELQVSSVSGALTGLRASGSLKLKTVSGDVRLGQSALEMLTAKTVSGDLYFETGLESGPYQFDSVSGDVKLVVPQDTHCDIQMHSFSGEAFVGLSSTYVKRSGRVQQIVVQDGGPTVNFKSMSGDLSLLTPDQLKNPTPGQPAYHAKDHLELDRMSVLDRIARGEITVDEGIQIFSQEGK